MRQWHDPEHPLLLPVRGVADRAALHRRRLVRFRAATIAIVGLGALSLGTGGDTPVPWPGSPPSAAHVATSTEEAVELFETETTEAWLEAIDVGEDSEHLFIRQEDIDAGIISLEFLFNTGDAIFEHEFRPLDGYGDEPHPTLRRVHDRLRGGLDTFSCAGCHSVGGPDGAGAATQNAYLFGDGDRLSSANARNPPPVIGLGLVQAIAAEMTTELFLIRDEAIASAVASGGEVTRPLVAREVEFGSITARADGSLDTSDVQGVSEDLVIRPFGWKGDIDRLRRAVEDASRIHFGIQAHTLALGHRSHPDPERLGDGPQWFDPDDDGHNRELEEGALTAAAVYLAMLEVPVILPPHDTGLKERWARGSALFDEVLCSSCHKRVIGLNQVTWEEYSDTTDGPPVVIGLLTDGEAPHGDQAVDLFSDLKRHDMGPELEDSVGHPMGIPRNEWLTRPLWGLAETAPYMHDGRAGTIPEAILAHGGEAEASRDAFAALPEESQRDLHIFLLSLTREPKLKAPR